MGLVWKEALIPLGGEGIPLVGTGPQEGDSRLLHIPPKPLETCNTNIHG